MNSIAKKITGSVNFDIIGGNAEKFLNECTRKGIPIQKIEPTALGFTAQLPLRYYTRLHKTARKNRCRLKVIKKQGLYFFMFPYRHRWGILTGLALLLVALTIFPRMVWCIQFHDFTQTQQMQLREQLYNYGVQEGCMPSTEELMDIQQRLFLDSAEYGWIKLNFVAGKLVVEKISAVLPPEMEQTEPAAIVALCDGVIERIEVEGGFIEKHAGESVREGDVIISALRVGRRDKLHTERANAKIYAFVTPIYEVTVPFEYTATVPSMQTSQNYALFMFGHTFNMPFQKDKSSFAQSSVTRAPLTFFGMPLPATVIKTQYREDVEQSINLTQDSALELARSKIYEKLASDLPECEVLSLLETTHATETHLTLTIEFSASANIAKVVEGWNM